MKSFYRVVALVLSVMIFATFTHIVADAASYTNGYTGAMAGDGKIHTHGIDVSKWQKGVVNFTEVKNAGYTYVILKCGSTVGKDSCFEEFYSQAKAAGLNVGVYYYSYATTVAESKKDAENCLSWIEGKKFEYPIYFDYEDNTQEELSGTVSAQICYAFLDRIKAAGYLPGLYSMAAWLDQSWVTTSGLRNDYEGWIARYTNSGTYDDYGSVYSSQYGMYQYTSEMTINGKGPFDANICYKDYPSIVKQYGFNGYEAGNSLKNNETQKKVKPYVFDPVFYAERYSDVKNAFGDDEEKLYDHFLEYGIKEGRCASPYFDVAWYMTQNDQGLIDYCNGDYEKAYNHFLEYIESEDEMAGTPKKFSKILDINYYSTVYADMRNLSWKTEFDYLEHFADYGVNEYRQASSEFDPVSYAHYNIDLFNAFGVEKSKDYFFHYMHTGQFETHNPYRLMITEYADIGEEFYANITDTNSWKNLELVYDSQNSEYEDKNAIVINSVSDTDSQLWRFIRQTDGSYKIENVMYNKYLDGSRGYISAIAEKTGDDMSDQKWYLYERDGYCVMRAVSRNAVVDVKDGAVSDGSYVINEHYDGEFNQQFKINVVSESDWILGDVNNDSTISIVDATRIQLSLAQLCTFNYGERTRADVDGNSNINISDTTLIQRYLAQYEIDEPIGKPVSVE